MACRKLFNLMGMGIIRNRIDRVSCFNVVNRKISIHRITRTKNERENSRYYFSHKFGAGAAFGIISGFAIYSLFFHNKNNILTVYGLERDNSLRKRFNFIADIIEEAADAVVHIEYAKSKWMGHGGHVGSGASGFIVDSNGIVITCAHAVDNKMGATVKVILRNGQQYKGVVQDMDPNADLAVIRINGKNLPVLNLSSLSDLRTGEWVAAIGSPLNLSDSVTAGVVSSVHREARELGLVHKDMQYIQTDANITFGNSGGPLVNLDGEVIGVNVMLAAPGISFAVPADYVRNLLARRKELSLVEPPETNEVYFGVACIILTNKLLNDLTLLRANTEDYIPPFIKSGILVWKVMANSPAQLGGLQPGDIIYGADDKEVQSMTDLIKIMGNRDGLILNVWRKGTSLKINITPSKDF